MTSEEIESILKMQDAARHCNDLYVDDYYHQVVSTTSSISLSILLLAITKLSKSFSLIVNISLLNLYLFDACIHQPTTSKILHKTYMLLQLMMNAWYENQLTCSSLKPLDPCWAKNDFFCTVYYVTFIFVVLH